MKLKLVVLAILAVPMFASTIYYDVDIPFTLMNFSLVPLTFQQFNPSFGTLTSATVQFLPTNDTNAPFSYTAITTTGELLVTEDSLNVDFSVRGTLRLTSALFPSFPTTNLDAHIFGPDDVTLGQTIPWTDVQATLATVRQKTITSGLDPLIGPGTVQVGTVSGSGNLFGTLPASFSQTNTTQASFAARIVYDYVEDTQIPEPAASVLVGGALLGLGALLRRRKRA